MNYDLHNTQYNTCPDVFYRDTRYETLYASQFTIHENEIQSTNYFVRNYQRIMQNKPNFQKSQMNAYSVYTRNYNNFIPLAGQKNKPNTNPIQTQTKPILKRMNVNFCAKGYYKSKPKAVEKPSLLEVNSESLRKDW